MRDKTPGIWAGAHAATITNMQVLDWPILAHAYKVYDGKNSTKYALSEPLAQHIL